MRDIEYAATLASTLRGKYEYPKKELDNLWEQSWSPAVRISCKNGDVEVAF
jgi:hypothetical protein